MIPAKVTSHPTEALALLTDKWKGKPVVEGILAALVTPFDSLESSTWDVIEKRVLSHPDCVGVWLDMFGKVVGEERLGRDDVRYKAAIAVRIRVNKSEGRAVDVIEVALMLDATATFVEYRKLSWEVSIYDTLLAGDFIALLAQTKAITSYGVLLTAPWPESGTSIFEDSSDMTPEDVFESAV